MTINKMKWKPIVKNAMPVPQLKDQTLGLVSLEVATHCQWKKPKPVRWNCISFFSVFPLMSNMFFKIHYFSGN